LDQSFSLGEHVSLHLLADAFNVTNQQGTLTVDEDWTFAALTRTEDPDECGGPGTGTGGDCPEGNPLWGTPKTLQVPRTVRLGLRLSW